MKREPLASHGRKTRAIIRRLTARGRQVTMAEAFALAERMEDGVELAAQEVAKLARLTAGLMVVRNRLYREKLRLERRARRRAILARGRAPLARGRATQARRKP